MNRHAKSYFPPLRHITQTGHFIRVQNRPGNVHDRKSRALLIIKGVIRQLREKLPEAVVEFRLASVFVRQDIIKYFMSESTKFAMKVPMGHWLGIKNLIRKNPLRNAELVTSYVLLLTMKLFF